MGFESVRQASIGLARFPGDFIMPASNTGYCAFPFFHRMIVLGLVFFYRSCTWFNCTATISE
jgi:hypothetical protein